MAGQVFVVHVHVGEGVADPVGEGVAEGDAELDGVGVAEGPMTLLVTTSMDVRLAVIS